MRATLEQLGKVALRRFEFSSSDASHSLENSRNWNSRGARVYRRAEQSRTTGRYPIQIGSDRIGLEYSTT